MIFSGSKWRVILIVIAGFFIFGCAKETIIARVNGETITRKDLKDMLKRAGIKEAKTKEGKDAHRAMYPQLIDQLINEKLVLQAAKKENIKVDKKEVIRSYDEMVKTFPKEEDYLKGLKEKGMSKDMVLKHIEKDLIIGKFKETLARNLDIPDKELQDYYDKNLHAFTTTEELKLSMIKVNSIEDARKVKKELEQGASFEEMAYKHPAGHAEPGGETGWITLGTFPADMAKEIRKIKAGFFGGPIKGREGYYIIKVQEKKEKKVRSFDEVKENIRHSLLQQKKEERFRSWFQDTRKNAKIEVLQKG